MFRACPSEFVIPLSRYHKAVYAQISIGMRFGMMFETEESTKRRHMGTVIGVGDYDPTRWPNSKWRNLQVKWDEHGCDERPDRVSIWEIESPESLFVFPAMTTTSFKRQCLPGFVGVGSEEPLKTLLKPHIRNPNLQFGCHRQTYASSLSNIQGADVLQNFSNSLPIISTRKMNLLQEEAVDRTESREIQKSANLENNTFAHTKPYETWMEKPNPEQKLPVKCDQEAQETVPRTTDETEMFRQTFTENSETKVDEHSVNISGTSSPKSSTEANCQVPGVQHGGAIDPANQETLMNHRDNEVHSKENIPQAPRFETMQLSNISTLLPHPEIHLLPHLDHNDSLMHSINHQSFASPVIEAGSFWLSASDNTSNTTRDIFTTMNQENFNATDMFKFTSESDSHRHYPPTHNEEQVATSILSPMVQESMFQEDMLQSISGIQDLSTESSNPNSIYGTLHFDHCMTTSTLGAFGTLNDSNFHVPSDCMVEKLTSDQELQSQITSSSLADSHIFALQECAAGASCSSIDANDYILSKASTKQAYPSPLRTYTKVQKLGSVGRSVDVTRFKNYHELRCTIACMFGLEGQLEDHNDSEWKLVYVDYENDVLLVGDDPWEEFVNCVRCIKILSAYQVQQMSQEDKRFVSNSQLLSNQ